MESNSNLYLKQLKLGPMENYIYIVGDLETQDVIVVDPAWDVNRICKETSDKDLSIKAIFLTHCHPDHTNGIEDLLTTHDIPVYVSKFEAPFYRSIQENIKIIDGDSSEKIGDIKIKIIHTPGHSPGSQCFLIENNLLSGDTLFIDSCGRCDLPGSDIKSMYVSIYEKLMNLPDNTIIYPGHQYHSLTTDTIGAQKKTNTCMKFTSFNEFSGYLLG